MAQKLMIRMAVIFHWNSRDCLGWATAFDGSQGQALELTAATFRGTEKGKTFLARNKWEEIRGLRVLFVSDDSGRVLGWTFDGPRSRKELESWLYVREYCQRLEGEEAARAKLPVPSAVVGRLTSQDLAQRLAGGLGRDPREIPRPSQARVRAAGR